MKTECDIRKNNKTFPSSATTTITKRVTKFNYSQVNLLVEPSGSSQRD